MALKLVDDKEDKQPADKSDAPRHFGTMSVSVRIGGGKPVTQADIERQLKNRSTL